MNNKLISNQIVSGTTRGGHRALLHSLGIRTEDLQKPFVAIVNSWNEIVPGCAPLKEIAEFVKRGVLEAGGIPFEFCTIGVCDGLTQGHSGMSYSLPSRDLIADSIEIMLRAHCFDGAVFLGSCDKITPGMLIAALRVNIPSIFVQSGPMLNGMYKGHKISLPSLREYAGKYIDKQITQEELAKIELCTMPTLGSCAMLGTANSMSCVVETLGLSLPLSSTTPPFMSQKRQEATKAGQQIVKLILNDIKPKDIVTKKSIENALRVGYAIGSSTNLVLHMADIASEADINLTLSEMDYLSATTPYIAKIHPSQGVPFNDLHYAGGVPAILKSLQTIINTNERTVTGTVQSIIDNAEWEDKEIIRPMEKAFNQHGALKVLKGTLAPKGAVVKLSGVDPDMYIHRGPACVFENMEASVEAIKTHKIKPGSVIVIRNEGPIGGPGMREMQLVTTLLVGSGLSNTTALVTDGRFSGATRGPCIGHISPEAALDGPIAYVKDGDFISIDLYNGILSLEVPEEELCQRRQQKNDNVSPSSQIISKVLRKFITNYKLEHEEN